MNNLIELLNVMVTSDYSLGTEDSFFNRGYQVFDCEASGVDDYRPTIYSKDGVILKVCHDYGYFEILGLSNEDFAKVEKAYEAYVNLRG